MVIGKIPHRTLKWRGPWKGDISVSKEYRWQGLVIAGIRKIWLQSPMRRGAMNRAAWKIHKPRKDGTPAKRATIQGYECEVCKQIFQKKDVTVHHIVDVRRKGWDWNWFIEKMFCGSEGLQVLCKECHKKAHKEVKDGV